MSKLIKESDRIHTVTTCDTFEAGFYLTKNAVLIGAELIEENQKKICTFTFQGEDLSRYQIEYFNCTAFVNLWDFRRCLTRINSLIGSVKANAKKESRVNK